MQQNDGRWTEAEHKRFIEGLKLFGKDWRLIEEHISTRTCSQIRSHAQKYFLRFDKLKEESMQSIQAPEELRLAHS
jgi:SHAQKYF class myb-like DNA-binding protein